LDRLSAIDRDNFVGSNGLRKTGTSSLGTMEAQLEVEGNQAALDLAKEIRTRAVEVMKAELRE